MCGIGWIGWMKDFSNKTEWGTKFLGGWRACFWFTYGHFGFGLAGSPNLPAPHLHLVLEPLVLVLATSSERS